MVIATHQQSITLLLQKAHTAIAAMTRIRRAIHSTYGAIGVTEGFETVLILDRIILRRTDDARIAHRSVEITKESDEIHDDEKPPHLNRRNAWEQKAHQIARRQQDDGEWERKAAIFHISQLHSTGRAPKQPSSRSSSRRSSGRRTCLCGNKTCSLRTVIPNTSLCCHS